MRQILALGFTAFLSHGAAAQGAVAAESTPPPAVADVVIEQQPVDIEPATPEVATLQVIEAGGVSLTDFRWIARPVVVFADSPADPRFAEQMEFLLARPEALIERDVVVLTDTDPSARSDVRLKLRPRGFMLTLIDKDGTINLRKPRPWDVRELTRAIDKMPSRRQEVRERKQSLE